MIVVYQSVIFQLSCVILFTLLYYLNRDEFRLSLKYSNKNNLKINVFDCLYTSVTIQAGVGYNGMEPKTTKGKLIIIIQQLIMICSTMFIFYIFTKHILSL